jgi:hypothetical protein
VHRIRLSFRYPGEEDAAMTTALNPRGAQWGYFFPEMMLEHFHKYVLFEELPAAEQQAWQADFLFLLKKISLANQSKRLVLKSPPNTARVKLLLSLFPNARFIFIHRNPYEVYASNKRFWTVTNRIYALGDTRTVDPRNIILETYAKTMQRYLQDKVLIPSGQLIEIAYEDLIQQPLATGRKIYDELQLPDFGPVEGQLQRYLAGQRSYVRLQHELPSAERELVSRQWEPFIRYWGYELQ